MAPRHRPMGPSPRLSSRGPIQAACALQSRLNVQSSPRLSSRGPIQARSCTSVPTLTGRSPRLSSRGPIQARALARGGREPWGSLHDYPVVAPFKPLQRRGRDRLRHVSTTIQSWPHSSIIASQHGEPVAKSPRLSSRGPIQASTPPPRPTPRRSASPRLSSRGPIQASRRSRSTSTSTCLHDYPVVAPFKPASAGVAVPAPRVSTTIQSWPHSSPPVRKPSPSASTCLHDYPVVAPFKRSTAASAVICSGSPRLSSRGPIQAGSPPGGRRAAPVSTTIQSWPHSSKSDGAKVLVAVGVSTTIQSWPHSSFPSSAQAARMPLSPRLSSRGPIQARTTWESWDGHARGLHDYPVVAPFKPVILVCHSTHSQSPRLSSRGPIQAATCRHRLDPVQPGLHDYPVVAPFKPRLGGQARGRHAGLHDYPVVAPFKRHASGPVSVQRWRLHDYPVVAPFKRYTAPGLERMLASSPRLSSRGPIQATKTRCGCTNRRCRLHDYPVVAPFKLDIRSADMHHKIRLHDYPVVAPFKRDAADVPGVWVPGLHDYPVVAPFKRGRCGGRDDASAGVSTTIQSWPHSSPVRIRARLPAMPSSPRLSSRGPIQAHPRSSEYSSDAGLHDYPVVAPFKRAWPGSRSMPPSASPRLSSRGPIQAGCAGRAREWCVSLHDYPVVAPFKPRAGESTQQDPVFRSPRLSSRGPIQARRSRSKGCRSSMVSTTIQSWPHSSSARRAARCSSASVSTTIQSWPHSSRPVGRVVEHGHLSPRLSSRGPIQARRARRRCPCTPGLHDYPVVAPFKRAWSAEIDAPRTSLHDYPVVAPFKPPSAIPGASR